MRTVTRLGSEPRASAWSSARLVDIFAPVVVVGYILLQFNPFHLLYQFPGAATSALLVSLGVGVLALTPPDRLARLPVSIPALAFLGWGALSITWSVNASYTAFFIRGEFIPMLILVLVAGTIPPARLVNVVVRTVLAVTLFSLAMSVLWPAGGQVILDEGSLQVGFRGAFVHKNLLGIFVVLTLAAVLPLLRPPRVSQRTRRLLIAVLVLTGLGTRSATAAGGLAVLALVWWWLGSIEQVRTPRERRLVMAFSLGSIVAGGVITVGALPALLDLYDKDLTLSGRTTIWRESWVAISDRLWAGYGYGGLFNGPIHPVTADLWERIGFGVPHAHNGIVQVALELGAIGVLLVVLVVVQALRTGMRCLRDRALVPHGQWLLLTTATLLVMSIAEPILQGTHLAWLVLVWTAALLARRTYDRDGASAVSGLDDPGPGDAARPEQSSRGSDPGG